MSDQELINVLDYLGEKFTGIGQGVIDWTSETALPYLQDLIQRIITYNIVIDSVSIVVTILFIIFALIFAKHTIKNYLECKKNKGDNLFFTYVNKDWIEITNGGLVASIVMSIGSLFSIITLILAIVSLIRWIFIPEIELFSFLQSLIPTAQ